MDVTELRANALANLRARGLDPARVLPPDELEQFRVTFECLDEDGDGSVTAAELRRALAAEGSAPFVTEVRVDEMLRVSDLDGDGELSLDELVMTAATRKLGVLEQRAWNTFSHFDIDADGYVDRAELARLVAAGATAEDVAALLEDADGDGDGRIDYDEFLTWYTGHGEPRSARLGSSAQTKAE